MSSVNPTMNLTVVKKGGQRLRAKILAVEAVDIANSYEVGWPTESKYKRRKVAGKRAGVISTGRIAKYLNFGFLNSKTGTFVPERPFFSQGNERFKPILRRRIFEASKVSPTQRPTVLQLEEMGRAHVAAIKNQIVRGKFAKNTEFTIRYKAGSHPLIDTAQLHNDLTSVVDRKV